MSIKTFIMKKTLQLKGMKGEQADAIIKKLEENPGLAESMKAIEDNKELKNLMEKIQREIEEKKKSMPEEYAMLNVMSKYKAEFIKYRKELGPLMEMLQQSK